MQLSGLSSELRSDMEIRVLDYRTNQLIVDAQRCLCRHPMPYAVLQLYWAADSFTTATICESKLHICRPAVPAILTR